MPVKDNLRGVLRFLTALRCTHATDDLPREIIIVDNNSRRPVRIPDLLARRFPPSTIKVLRCGRPGPAAARNDGYRASTGFWVLFADSDCVPTRSFITGYVAALDGSIAYAGNVRATSRGLLSRYYDSQHILVPPATLEGRPDYLVTANALVWRTAIDAVGGFDERFVAAGGEDIDLAIRLSASGHLGYGFGAVVEHQFSESLRDFVGRFVRYGRGNRMLEAKYGLDLTPQPFAAAEGTAAANRLAEIQYLAMRAGYERAPL